MQNLLRVENVASTDLLKYTLEVLNLFGYNTSLLSIYIGTIENCGNYVQVKEKISEFSPLLLLSQYPIYSKIFLLIKLILLCFF